MRNARPRLPRARVTLPMLGLIGIALVVGPILRRGGEMDEATALGLARDRGILPLVEWPAKGTEILQWDPELQEFAPNSIGRVVDPAFYDHKRRFALVKRPDAPGLLIVVKPHDLRYWVRKTKR